MQLAQRVDSAFNGPKLEDTCEIIKGRKPLGKGSFGTVWAGKLKTGGGKCAIKALDKRRMKEMKVPDTLVKAEVDLMRECIGKAQFVQLIDFVDASSQFYLVLEFCDGGDLEDATKEGQGKLGERQVGRFMKQMLEGLQYLHSKTICHRDIKPQNSMVVGRASSENAKVKLGDFGIAVKLPKEKLLKEKVGTPAFMAPEMHLLPNRSAGYDHKVDMWAIGAVMVFLLANEYPFVDGSGRLLRDQLLQGDLPIWDANVFSGLFQRVQEAAGIRPPRPSKVAQDLVRKLLNPKRQHRIGPTSALRHDWFVKPQKPQAEQQHEALDDMPLLVWNDFEEGLTSIERDFKRFASAAADAAFDAVGGVQVAVSGIDQPPLLDPDDDRIRSCVVCYHDSGSLGYLCPQCHHTVCMSCLRKLPKAQCPHCRRAAEDVAVAQAVSKFAKSFSDDVTNAARLAAREVGNADQLVGKAAEAAADGIAVDSAQCAAWQHSAEAEQRRAACLYCKEASSSTNHVCQTCSASICFSCAREKLTKEPGCCCPGCKDPGSVHAIVEYLAYAEGLNSAVAFIETVPGALTARASELSESLRRGASQGYEAWTTRVSHATEGSPSASSPLGGEASPTFDSKALKRTLTSQALLEMDHKCFLCASESSSWDLACPLCRCSVCSACLRQHVAKDPRCPNCHDDEFCNAQTVNLMLSASQVRDSANMLWDGLLGVGRELFSNAPQPTATAGARPPRPHPAAAHAGVARLSAASEQEREECYNPFDTYTQPTVEAIPEDAGLVAAAAPPRQPGIPVRPTTPMAGCPPTAPASPCPPPWSPGCNEDRSPEMQPLATARSVIRSISSRSVGSLGPTGGPTAKVMQVDPRDDPDGADEVDCITAL